MKILFTLLLLATVTTVHSQTDKWSGEWRGDLEIRSRYGESQTVPMKLLIGIPDAEGSIVWKITYGNESSKLEKDYALFPTEDPKIFKLDEKNSIILDFYFDGSGFYSTFEVSGALINSSYVLENDEILFTVISSDLKRKSVSSGEDNIPEVTTYPVYNVQSATLKRNPD